MSEFTDLKSIADLRPGDMVRGRMTGNVYIITNPSEWEVMRRPDGDLADRLRAWLDRVIGG